MPFFRRKTSVKPQTSRPRRIVLWAAGGMLAVCLAGAAAFILMPDAWLRGMLGEKGSAGLGREFAVDGDITIAWDWTQPRVHLGKIRIGNMPGGMKPNMVEIEALDFRIKIWNLLRGELNLPEVALTRPDILLEKRDANAKNWDFPAFSKANAMTSAALPQERGDFPLIGLLTIKNGTLTYRDAPKDLTTKLSIESASGDDSAEGRFNLSGSGTLQGKVFDLDAAGGSLSMLRGGGAPYPLNLRIKMGGTMVAIEGRFADPVKMTGIDARLDLQGDNLADLFYLTQIPLPPTPPYRLAGQLRENDKIWTFSDFKGRVGGSDLAGNLRDDTSGERGFIAADLVSDRLDMKDLAGFIGAPAVGPGGAASPEQKAEAQRKAADPRLLPDIPLDLTRLRAADMDVKLKAKHINAPGWPMDDMDVRFLLKDGVLRIDPLRFGMANGQLSGALALDGRQDIPAVDIDLLLKRLSFKEFFKGSRFEDVSGGYFGGKFKLAGRGRSLADVLGASDGRVTLLMSGGRISKLLVDAAGVNLGAAAPALLGKDEATDIRCAVGDFNVAKGILNSEIVVFDTAQSNIDGEAHVDLHDETIDARLRAHPKEPSLPSARTAIVVNGRLKNPAVGLDPKELAARGAAAAALSVVLTPLAGLIPFIELGLGEDSDCRGLIAAARMPTEKPAP